MELIVDEGRSVGFVGTADCRHINSPLLSSQQEMMNSLTLLSIIFDYWWDIMLYWSALADSEGMAFD